MIAFNALTLMNRSTFLLIIINILFLTGCDICFAPGAGYNVSTRDISVPVKLDGANILQPQTLWVDSGEFVEIDEKLPISVSGSINLCEDVPGGLDDCSISPNCKQVLVPLGKCVGYKRIDPSMDPNSYVQWDQDKDKYEDHWPKYVRSPDTFEVDFLRGCDLAMRHEEYYIDSGIKVNPGDSLMFKLIPAVKYTVNNCKNLPSFITTYGGCNGDECAEKGQCLKDGYNKGKCINPVTICETGKEFEINGQKVNVGPFKGKTYTSDIDNDFSPYSNKIAFSANHVITRFIASRLRSEFKASIKAALIDLRPILPYDENNAKIPIRPEYDSVCPAIRNFFSRSNNSNDRPYIEYEPLGSLSKYHIYDVLYRCNFLRKNDGDWKQVNPIISGDVTIPMFPIATVRYDWEDKNMLTLEQERNRKRYIGLDPSRYGLSWIDGILVRVADINNSNISGSYSQCFPSGTKNIVKPYKKNVCHIDSVMKLGLPLGIALEIDDKITPGSAVELHAGMAFRDKYNMIKYYDAYMSNNKVVVGSIKNSREIFGGYNLEVRKICVRENGKDLYMYVGDAPPTMRPGDPGTIHLNADLDVNPTTGITTVKKYVINGDGTSNLSGKIYFGIKDAALSDTVKLPKARPDNAYTVSITKAKIIPNFSEPFDALIKLIRGLIYGDETNRGAVRVAYETITHADNFNSIQVVLVLYVALYGVMFALGLVQHAQSDLMIRMIKICTMIMLFSDQSWNFFGQTLYEFFIQGTSYLIGAFSGVLQTEKNSFAFFDATFGALLASETWLRFLSIMLTGPVGFIVFLMIMWGVALFAMAFIEAIISYVMSLIGLSIVMGLAPIFIPFILFQRTRSLFDGWIKMLVNFSLKPVFLFSGLAFLNQILLSIFYSINNFGVCASPCWMMLTLIGSGETAEGICILDAILPVGFSATDTFDDRIKQSTQDIQGVGFLGLPFTISSIIIFVVVANLMKSFAALSESIVHSITGSMSSMMEANRSASQSMYSLFGKDDETKQAIRDSEKSTNKGKQRVAFKGAYDKPGEDDAVKDYKDPKAGKDSADGASPANLKLPSVGRSTSSDVQQPSSDLGRSDSQLSLINDSPRASSSSLNSSISTNNRAETSTQDKSLGSIFSSTPGVSDARVSGAQGNDISTDSNERSGTVQRSSAALSYNDLHADPATSVQSDSSQGSTDTKTSNQSDDRQKGGTTDGPTDKNDN